METTGEMNWQLLIKMVSSLLSPLPFDSLFGSWKIDWEPEELAARILLLGGSRLQRRTGLRWRRGSFRSSSGGDAVNILFVHANYSSSVTLLEIEGTGAPLSLSLPYLHRLSSPTFLALFVLSTHLPGLFSFHPARSSPLPWGFPNGPRLHNPPSPLTTYSSYRYFSLFFSAWHEISLSLLEDFTKDFNFPATPASTHRLPFAR